MRNGHGGSDGHRNGGAGGSLFVRWTDSRSGARACGQPCMEPASAALGLFCWLVIPLYGLRTSELHRVLVQTTVEY